MKTESPPLDNRSEGEEDSPLEGAALVNLGTNPSPTFAMRNLPRMGGEIDMAKKPTPKRIGLVSVSALGEKKWGVRWTDPSTGKEVKKRFSGIDLKGVEEIAAFVTVEILAGRGLRPATGKRFPSLREAFASTIRTSGQRESSRKNTAYFAARFEDWIERRHPRVRTWADLRPMMVAEYVRELEGAGKAFDTVRMALQPVKLAWRHVLENYPGEIQPLPRIKQAPAPKKVPACLEPSEVRDLLDWLGADRPALRGTATLQALAGLRVYEAAAIRRRDVDFEKGTVTVTDTGFHKPKTLNSYRTVPVCREVLEVLSSAMESQKVIPSTGELFQTKAMNPWTKNSLSTAWRRAILSARKAGFALEGFQPHRLRSAFVTMVSRAGASDRILKAYVGHSAGDMLGDHYRAISTAELRSVSSLMEGWRTFPDEGRNWKLSGNSVEGGSARS